LEAAVIGLGFIRGVKAGQSVTTEEGAPPGIVRAALFEVVTEETGQTTGVTDSLTRIVAELAGVRDERTTHVRIRRAVEVRHPTGDQSTGRGGVRIGVVDIDVDGLTITGHRSVLPVVVVFFVNRVFETEAVVHEGLRNGNIELVPVLPLFFVGAVIQVVVEIEDRSVR